MTPSLPARVVVTGMGALTPLGPDVASLWDGLVAGRSGIGPIRLFNPDGFATTFAGEVKDWDPHAFFDRKEVRRFDRFIQFAVVSAAQALAQARYVVFDANAEETAVIIGSGIGGLQTITDNVLALHKRGPRAVSPFVVPMMIPDMASGQVSIAVGAKGHNYCVTSACASSADAIGAALETVRRGDARAVLAGGAEAPITPIGVAGFNQAGALSRRNSDPEGACRPFDAERDGFVLAEGAAILLMESLESAQARGATILAEVLSYGQAGDGYHVTQPAPGGDGSARSMRQALRKAGLEASQIDYINAHGTSTQMNDRAETAAIKAVFGEGAYGVPVSSTKSMTGHLIGAAGAVEAVASIQTIREGIIPPTINYARPDPDCDLDYVPNAARRKEIRTVLSNSLGFGGHNATLIFARFED